MSVQKSALVPEKSVSQTPAEAPPCSHRVIAIPTSPVWFAFSFLTLNVHVCEVQPQFCTSLCIVHAHYCVTFWCVSNQDLSARLFYFVFHVISTPNTGLKLTTLRSSCTIYRLSQPDTLSVLLSMGIGGVSSGAHYE